MNDKTSLEMLEDQYNRLYAANAPADVLNGVWNAIEELRKEVEM